MSVRSDLRKLSRGDPIEFEWYDIVSVAEWINFLDIKKHNLAKIRSRGFFVETSRSQGLSCLYVAAQWSEDQVGNMDVIPLFLIAKIKREN